MDQIKNTPELVWVFISTEGCLGRCPIFSMRITSTGYARMEDHLLFDPIPRFEFSKTRIREKDFKRLKFTIEKAELFSFKQDNSFFVSCIPVYNLKVKFKGHRVISISENAKCSGKKVAAIFNCFLNLRLSQDWKLISSLISSY
jgi:hypothetical protein